MKKLLLLLLSGLPFAVTAQTTCANAVTVTDGTAVTGVTVNGTPLVLGTGYSISGNVLTVAVTSKADTVVIQTTGGINNPVTIQ